VPIESHPSEPRVGLSPQDALPGLATAFDEEAMKGYVQAALFRTDRPSYTVERCTPTRPLYLPGESCLVRYRFRATNSASGEVLEPIVMGRVFPNQSSCAAYMSKKLAPVAARMRGRPEVAAFAEPAAMIDALNMVVHVWPVDGELPTLVDATDRRRMIEVFRDELPKALRQPFVVDDCRIELVSSRRRQRCVLRYTVAGKTGGDQVRNLTVYGKVTASRNETLNSRMLEDLRDRIREPAALYRFTLPRSFGARPDLQLMLLEALRGEPQIGPALKARLRGQPPPDAPALEEMVAAGGQVASMLHSSGVKLGRPRTLDDELAGLLGQIASVRRFVPSFGAGAQSWLERIAALAEQSGPLKLSLCHGDFKHEQLLFDGPDRALVDFDAMCQAEPALDLGKFLAHLRTEAQKIQRRASVSSPLGEELGEQFLRAYVSAAGDQMEGERRLRLRTTLYEAVALLRLALRSQQDLDESRVDMTAGLLEERLEEGERGRPEYPFPIRVAPKGNVLHRPLQRIAISLTPGDRRKIAPPHHATGAKGFICHLHERWDIRKAHRLGKRLRARTDLAQPVDLDIGVGIPSQLQDPAKPRIRRRFVTADPAQVFDDDGKVRQLGEHVLKLGRGELVQ
jgi:Phosphotransferase enzyme family